MKSDDASLLSPCHCGTLRKAARRVTQFYDTALAATGIKVTQLSILAEINRRREKPPTLGELAEALVMDRSTLGHNLRPLERDRLVEFAADEYDGRARRIRLTRQGVARIQQSQKSWKAAQAQFESAFGATSTSKLRELLLKLAALEFEDRSSPEHP